MHSALQLEPLLKHPNLRVYVMDAGWPMLDDMLAVLWDARRHVGTSASARRGRGAVAWRCPARSSIATFSASSMRGWRARDVRFGSDGVAWRERARHQADRGRAIPDARQKKAIFYDNAARFLRLS
jgi:hypothetical protein